MVCLRRLLLIAGLVGWLGVSFVHGAAGQSAPAAAGAPVKAAGAAEAKAAGAAGARAADSYARESLVVERLASVYRYAKDGTGSRELSAVTRLQSDAAAQQYSVLRIPFAGASEHVEVQYVRVRKADGTVVETPATDAQELPQEVTRQAPFYSDLKELQIPVRSLRGGDRLEYAVRVLRTAAEAPGQIWGQDSFSTTAVALDEVIELHVPAEMYVKVWSPQHAPVKTTTGGETVYRWTGAQTEATVGADGKPRDAPEMDPQGVLPDIAWTSFHSWAEVGAWYRGMEGERVHADAEVRAKVAELVAGKTAPAEKIQALYSYVATEVRYIGVAFGTGRYQPHPASDVLRNQYGDCKDKHTLLAAMLDAAGIPADAVLIGAGLRMNEEVPSPSAFNHLITAVPMGSGTVWLDATAEVAPYRMLLLPLRDKRALRVPDHGEAALARTPAELPFPAFSNFVVKGTLSTAGTATTHIVYTTRGDDEVVLRALLRQVPPTQWGELTQNISRQLGFTGTVSHTEVAKPEATVAPERLEYDYEREKLGDWDNYRIVTMFPQVYLPPVDEKRPPKYAIVLGAPRVDTAITELRLPAGWGAELPEAVHQETPFLTFRKTYRIVDGALVAERRIEVLRPEVPAAEWSAYKRFLDATLEPGEPYVQLTRTDHKAAASEAGPPIDPGGTTEGARLVREAAVAMQRQEFDEAERLLEQAKAASPEQSGVWSGLAYVALHRLKLDEAVVDFEKEVAGHPQMGPVYLALAQTQASLGRQADADTTLRKLLTAVPTSTAGASMLAKRLQARGEDAAALEVLRTVLKMSAVEQRTPMLRAQVAAAEVKVGNREPGKEVLESLARESSDAYVLNAVAWGLAEAGFDLAVAETASRKGLAVLATESEQWHAGEIGPQEMARGSLVMASWDTLAWVLFQEGKLAEAERYAQAAWRNQPSPVIGLHLGRVEEARGDMRASQVDYELARLTGHQNVQGGAGNAVEEDAVMRELKQRADALWQRGLRPAYKDGREELQRLRTVRLGESKGQNGVGEFDLMLGKGAVIEAGAAREGHNALPQGDSLLRAAKVPEWTPGDAVRLPRRGMLNCHSDGCEFIFFPL